MSETKLIIGKSIARLIFMFGMIMFMVWNWETMLAMAFNSGMTNSLRTNEWKYQLSFLIIVVGTIIMMAMDAIIIKKSMASNVTPEQEQTHFNYPPPPQN